MGGAAVWTFAKGLWSVASGAVKVGLGLAAVDVVANGGGVTQHLAKDGFTAIGKAQAEASQEAGWHGFYKMIQELAMFIESIAGSNKLTQGMNNWANERLASRDDGTMLDKAAKNETVQEIVAAVPLAKATQNYLAGDYENGAQALTADVGGFAGAAIGASYGAAAGTTVGALFGGVGAVPGAAIGWFVGGGIGWLGGSMLTDTIWEYGSSFFRSPATEPTRRADLENMGGQFNTATLNEKYMPSADVAATSENGYERGASLTPIVTASFDPASVSLLGGASPTAAHGTDNRRHTRGMALTPVTA